MGHVIRSVEKDSIADQLGLRKGDVLLKMNGERLLDWIDYQALSCSDHIVLLIERDGVQTEYDFEKDDYEPLGLAFENDMLDGLRLCLNKCLFCFVDQLPACARDSMRVKDDDWRMSLMMGNFVTMTNVGPRELDRIIRRHASPLYISVHATEPELRKKLLGNPRGGNIMEQLEKLAAGGVSFHAQAVLCPDLNCGEALERTMSDLMGLYPACRSLALVPVGLTGHREGLENIRVFDRDSARTVLGQANRVRERMLQKYGTRFVFPSDELYLKAEMPFPEDEAYEDYEQIDNGIGLCRQLITEFEEAYMELPARLKREVKSRHSIAIATGVSAQPILKNLLDAHPVTGVEIKVYAITNRYFGETVTVAGLVTGGDLVAQMKDRPSEAILITECMIRSEDKRFLDNMLLTEAEAALERPIVPVGRRGDELLDAIVRFAEI